MRHEKARQRVTDGKWDWTAAWSDRVITYPPCHQGCNHDTAEEAERHRYEYEMDRLRESTTDAHYKCEAPNCETLTNKLLGPGDSRMSYLCDEHRTKEVYQELHPFVPGIETWAS